MTDDSKMTDDSIKIDLKKLKHGVLYEKLRRAGYKIDKRIINTAFIIALVLLGYEGYTEGIGNHYYINCPADSDKECKNNFYECNDLYENCPSTEFKNKICTNEPAFCITPFLEPGYSIGKKPSLLSENFHWIILVILGGAYLLNHNIHNSKKQREERKKEWKDSE